MTERGRVKERECEGKRQTMRESTNRETERESTKRETESKSKSERQRESKEGDAGGE